MPECVDRIYVVDDCCPENSGDFVSENCQDSRVSVLKHTSNLGVGGAVLSGYQAAILDGVDVIVKVDGDGQMDPGLIPVFVEPILSGMADYTKGNRFYNIDDVSTMPKVRLLGNAFLSFLTKISSGYWNLFDPTNGYTAIHAKVAGILPVEKISKRYFFETDMLFRLRTYGAVVVDVPMKAVYADEVSNLSVRRVFFEFAANNLKNLVKRVFYDYYLRNLSVASLELPLGILLLVFGVVFGVFNWNLASSHGVTASAGTVMLAALPVILGVQFLLSFLSYDIFSVPKTPIHRLLH
jgi:glycosyltransferase involved in cell wall biosynthesis